MFVWKTEVKLPSGCDGFRVHYGWNSGSVLFYVECGCTIKEHIDHCQTFSWAPHCLYIDIICIFVWNLTAIRGWPYFKWCGSGCNLKFSYGKQLRSYSGNNILLHLIMHKSPPLKSVQINFRPNTRDGTFVYSKIFTICSSWRVKLFLGLHVVHVRVKCLKFQKDIWHSKSKISKGYPAFHGKLCFHFTLSNY